MVAMDFNPWTERNGTTPHRVAMPQQMKADACAAASRASLRDAKYFRVQNPVRGLKPTATIVCRSATRHRRGGAVSLLLSELQDNQKSRPIYILITWSE